MDNESIPYGHCFCGCGQKTNLAKVNNISKGWVKDEPIKYIAGHGKKGKTGLRAKPKTGIYKNCKNCGEKFYVTKHKIETAKFCSQSCYLSNRWPESRYIKRYCLICNTAFKCFASDHQTTCGEICRIKRKSEANRGANSHLWRGGKMAPYNGEWRSKRKEALRRDGYKCTICNSVDRVQVHHIIPYRYSKSHDLSNLTSLCRSCHSKEEWKVNVHFLNSRNARREHR